MSVNINNILTNLNYLGSSIWLPSNGLHYKIFTNLGLSEERGASHPHPTGTRLHFFSDDGICLLQLLCLPCPLGVSHVLLLTASHVLLLTASLYLAGSPNSMQLSMHSQSSRIRAPCPKWSASVPTQLHGPGQTTHGTPLGIRVPIHTMKELAWVISKSHPTLRLSDESC